MASRKTKVKVTRADIEAIQLDEFKTLPPYEMFRKLKLVGPNDPEDLASVYNNVNKFGTGLFSIAIRMMEGLIDDDYKRQAREIGYEITQKSKMPGVVIYTGVIEKYAATGGTLDALKTYKRMLDSGVAPNAYTYGVLIVALAADSDPVFLGLARKYTWEMMWLGMMPNVVTYTTLFKGFVLRGMVKEGKEFLENMKAKGFVPDEKAVKKVLSKRKVRMGKHMAKILFNILFGK